MVLARGARRTWQRGRDRRGRGLRGTLYPRDTPAFRSRGERFDAAVLEALEPIEQRWHDQLTQLDVAVDDVPEVVRTGVDQQHWGEDVVQDGNVPLAKLVPAGVDRKGLPTRARIVLYRRPLEARAGHGADLTDLLHDVLVEQVASYLGLDPDMVDDQ
ncbi:MAG TPA: metallopeptidase family protein [Pseudonocardiaceae bacterium]